MSKWIHNLQKKITHGTDIQPNGRPLNERQGLRKNAVRSTGSGRPKKSVEGFYSRSKWINNLQKKSLRARAFKHMARIDFYDHVRDSLESLQKRRRRRRKLEWRLQQQCRRI